MVHVDGSPIVAARPWRESPSQRLEPHAVVEGFDALCPLDTSNATPATTVAVEVHAYRLDGSSQRLGPVAVSTALDDLPVPQDALEFRRQTDALREAATVADERRLLVVTHSLDLGGAQLYVEELLRGLLPSPDVACLVVAPADGPLRRPLEQRGITVEVLGNYPGDIVDYEARVAALATLARAHGVNRALVNTMSAALGADTCRRLGIPYVWAIHESVDPLLFWIEAYGGAGYHPEVRKLGLDALNHAEQLVFEADATLELYRSTAPAGRCVKIPYGIDFTSVDDYRARVDRAGLRASLGYSDEEIVFVCVGTMEPRKLQTGLVLAFHAIVRRFPHARLVLVGDLPERPYSAAVHELIDRLGVAATVAVVPVTPDVYDWYHAADVVVSASDLESMPRSLMEAMAFERVILSTAVFGVTELIADGRTGFLMAPRELDAMIEGFERVLALSADERTAIGRAASASVRAAHDASAYVSAFRTLLLG
jgi:glycosyltransferase involved in cell wall biosynthesis